MGYTQRIADTEERLAEYIKAERFLLTGGQSYSIGNRSLTRADLKTITTMIRVLYGELSTLRRGNQITQHRVVPRDL